MSWRIVAQRVADGMVLSTSNLYFTAHDNAGAGVFRTAQSAKPGQEIELCHDVWPGRAVQEGLPRATNVRAASMYQASAVEH